MTKAYNIPCFKRNINLSSESQFNPGHNPSSGQNPIYQQQYRPQHMDATSASDITSLASYSFLRSTLPTDNFHRYASAPDISSQEENRQNKRNHSLLDITDFQEDNSRITDQPRQKQQRCLSPFIQLIQQD